jgi:engulfment/cell motility protein 1
MHNPKSPGPRIRRKSKGKEREKEKGTPATTSSLLMSPGPSLELAVNRYGFEPIFMRMCLVGDTLDGEEGSGGERFFRIIIRRLEGTGDLELVAQRHGTWTCMTKLTSSLGLVHICLRFGEREESRLYRDLVNILENLHIRRYVSVSIISDAS